MKQFYRIKSQAEDPSVVDIQVVDFIGDWIDGYWGFGVTAKQFVRDLGDLPEAVRTIRVHINSPGGDVWAAVNIANALRDQRARNGRKVETLVDGLAASAASILMMAGDPVRIADNGMVMVHNPWRISIGNAEELRKDAEQLDQVRDAIVSTYRWHSKLSEKELVALMAAETWMDADEAIEKGFATEKVEGLQAAAAIDRKALDAAKLTVPERFKARVEALVVDPEPEPGPEPEPTPARSGPAADAKEVLRLCREAKALDLAEELVTSGASLEAVKARLKAEGEKRAADEKRKKEIRALCETAKVPELADGLVEGGMSTAAVRAHLTKLTGMLDKAEIDTGLDPDARGHRHKPRIDAIAWMRQIDSGKPPQPQKEE